MIINLGKPEQIKSLMIARGAPQHMLRHSLKVELTDLSSARHERYVPIQPRQQMMHLEKTMEKPTGSWWLAIGSLDDDVKAREVALGIMQQSTLHSVTDVQYARPLWWPIYGGRYDKLRDDEAFRSSIGRVGMLILTNVAENSTHEKIEKCVDLLHMYSSIPRIVVIDGLDPLEFSTSRLHRRPDRVLFLHRRGKTYQV